MISHLHNNKKQAFAGLPYIDFGARLYDPATARWNTSDPLAEKYLWSSPYVYCLDNPVNSIDPDGNVVWFIPLVKGLAGAAAGYALGRACSAIGAGIGLSASPVGAVIAGSVCGAAGNYVGSSINEKLIIGEL